MFFFWSEIGSGFGEPGQRTPTKNSQEYPPGIVKIKGKWRVAVSKMFMYGNNTRMILAMFSESHSLHSCHMKSL